MPSDIIDRSIGLTRFSRRTKRVMDIRELSPGSGATVVADMKPQHIAKKLKVESSSAADFDLISEKENLHRPKLLVPRSRPSKVLEELIADAPTDCSDFECSDPEFDPSDPVGMLYYEREARMADILNGNYHFAVFED